MPFVPILSMRALVASVLVGLVASGCAGSAPPAATAPAPPATATDAPGERSAMEARFWERREEARQRFTDADVAFMTGMIGHHAQALVMSELAPTNGARRSVRTLAARIINAQRDEIETMQRWLRDRGQPVPLVDDEGRTTMPAGTADPHAGHAMGGSASGHEMPGHDMAGGDHDAATHARHVADGTHARHVADGTHAEHHADEPASEAHDMAGRDMEGGGHPIDANGMHPGGHSMEGHESAGGRTVMDHAGMPGMLSEAQLDQLRAARGTEFDRLFLRYMIQHHGGALVMVDELISQDGAVQDEAAFKLAADVRVDQTTEIARMQQMLDALPGGDSSP